MEGEPITIDEYMHEFVSLRGRVNRGLEKVTDWILKGSDRLITKVFGGERAGRWSENSKVAVWSLIVIGYPMLGMAWLFAWIMERQGK